MILSNRNYTGDILNFGLAKETYHAQHSTRPESVKFVVVGDDVSVGRTQGAIVGRRYGFFSLSDLGLNTVISQRGLAGTVIVYKIACALSQSGAGLDDVSALAEWVSIRVGTIGAGLEHCHVRFP